MKNRLISVVAVSLLVLSNVSCFGPRKIQLTAAPEIPAAQSYVKVSATENGNTKIDLSVQHMATPDRVTPGTSIYVVWVRGNESNARSQNIGALKVDGDLNANLTAVTPLRSFELFVTAEQSQTVSEPSGKRLLYTSVSIR